MCVGGGVKYFIQRQRKKIEQAVLHTPHIFGPAAFFGESEGRGVGGGGGGD